MKGIPGPARWSRRTRVIAALAALVVTGAASLVILYRVLAPADMLIPARTAYPAAAAPQPEVLGTLRATPLVVDGRVRIFADDRQVRADGPVPEAYEQSPYWSYRRWPARLVGVVATDGIVVSQWSDGDVVGIDVATGQVAWQRRGPAVAGPAPDGRRTGAALVYQPRSLYTADSVVVATGAAAAQGYDARSGEQLWSTPLPRCERTEFTSGDRFAWWAQCPGGGAGALAAVSTTDGARLPDWRVTGPVTPTGCELGHSGCRALRAGGQGWLWRPNAASPVPAPALDQPGSWLADQVVVALRAGRVEARDLATGEIAWSWADASGPAQVIGVQPGMVHLLTPAKHLVTLDSQSGQRRSDLAATIYREPINWGLGWVYAAHGYVAIERLRLGAEPTDPDTGYFFRAHTVLFAAA